LVKRRAQDPQRGTWRELPSGTTGFSSCDAQKSDLPIFP
jgi:hypothetical protein